MTGLASLLRGAAARHAGQKSEAEKALDKQKEVNRRNFSHYPHHGINERPEPEPPERLLDLGRSLHVVKRSLRGGSETGEAIGDGCKGLAGRRARGVEGVLRAGVATGR